MHSRRSARETFGPTSPTFAPSLPLDSFKSWYRAEFSAQFFSADGQNPTDEPSKFSAFDFKGEFARFEIFSASTTIANDRSIFRVVDRVRIPRQNEKDRHHLKHSAFTLAMFVLS